MTADGGDIDVDATSTESVTATSIATSASISIGVAGAGAEASTTIGGTDEAYVDGGALTATGAVDVHATATMTANATAGGGSGGLADVSVMQPTATIGGTVEADVDGKTTVSAAGGLSIVANSTGATADATTTVVGVGLIAGTGANPSATADPNTLAYVGAGSVVDAAGNDVTVDAESTAEADAVVANDLAIGAITIQAVTITDNVGGETYAYVDDGASITAGGLSVTANATDTAQPSSSLVGIALAGSVGASGLTANVTPDVEAYVGTATGDGEPETTIDVTGDVTISSTLENATTQATIDGTNIGGLAAVSNSTTTATLTSTTDAEVGSNVSILAGGSLSVSASATQSTESSVQSVTGGAVARSGSGASATNDSSVTASVGDDSTLAAAGDVSITAKNTTTLAKAYIDNKSGGIVVDGRPTSTLSVSDPSSATLGTGDAIRSSEGDFTLQAVGDDENNLAQTSAGAGGLVLFANTSSTATASNPATATVGVDTTVAAFGALTVQAETDSITESKADADIGGLGTNVTATSTSTATSTADVNVDQGAAVSGGTVSLLAGPLSTFGRTNLADPTSSASDFGDDSTSTANVTTAFSSQIFVAGDTTITGAGQVNLTASNVDASSTAHPHATSNAAGADTNANANDSVNFGASVLVSIGSQIVAGSLAVAANMQVFTIDTDAQTSKDDIHDGGSATNTTNISNLTNAIEFGADVTITGAAPLLHIGAQGQVIAQSGGVTFQQVGSNLVVNPIDNTSTGTVTFTTAGDGSFDYQKNDIGVVAYIQGNPTIHFSPTLGAVDIINDSPLNLVVSDIEVVNPSPSPSVSVSSPDAQGFSYTTDTSSSVGTAILISNTSSSNIILDGSIVNPLGSTTISDANFGQTVGGSIFGGTSGQSIQTGQLTLVSAAGNIGGSGGRIDAQLVQSSSGSPSLQASAAGVDYLDISSLDETNDPLVVTGTALTGTTVDVRFEDGATTTTGQPAPTPWASAYDLSGVDASGQLNVQAGTSTAVSVSLSGPGDLNVGTVASALGDVSLTAAGSIHLGTVTAYYGTVTLDAQGGAIEAPAGNTTTSVIGVNVTLDASDFIGQGLDGEALRIDSSAAFAGTFDASTPGPLTIDQVSGDLDLGTVSSGGLATLTAAGAIIDYASASGAVALSASEAILTAVHGIGSASLPLQSAILSLTANSGGGGLWLNDAGPLTVSAINGSAGLRSGGDLDVTASGLLLVDQDVSASGNVTLTGTVPAANGQVVTVADGVTVQSTGGSVTLHGAGLSGQSTAGVVTLAPLAVLSAATTVALVGDSPAGSVINLEGTVEGAESASITGGVGDDTINIDRLPDGVPITIDGGGYSSVGNTLNITGTAGPDTFNVAPGHVQVVPTGGPSVTIPYVNIQELAVNYSQDPVVADSQGGNDTFNVTGAGAATALYGGPGNDVLNLHASRQSGTDILSAPVRFVGGSGSNTANVFGTGTGDTFVMANEPTQDGQHVAALVGAGLQFTYSDPTPTSLQFNLNTEGGNSTIDVLGTAFPTVIQTGSGNNTIELGGYGPGAAAPVIALDGTMPGGEGSIFAETTALAQAVDGALNSASNALTITPPEAIGGFSNQVWTGFLQAIDIDGGSGTNTLGIDDSGDSQQRYPVLAATTIRGLGESEPIAFGGIATMAVDLGTADDLLTVGGTIAGAGPVTVNASRGSATVIVQGTSAPLDLIGDSTATTVEDTVVFDAINDLAFDPATAIESDDETIDFGQPVDLITGQQVIYDNGGGDSVGGLSEGQAYYVIVTQRHDHPARGECRGCGVRDPDPARPDDGDRDRSHARRRLGQRLDARCVARSTARGPTPATPS